MPILGKALTYDPNYIVYFGSLALNTTETNNTEPICSVHCNGRGICLSGQFCACYPGFFGTTCEITLNDVYPVIWPTLQYINAVAYTLLFLSSSWVLYKLIKENKDATEFRDKNSAKLASYVMGSYVFYEFFCMIFWFVDPFGWTLPLWLISLWLSSKILYAVILLGLLLSHWIEAFHIANNIVRSEQSLSIDEVAKKLNRMNKFKLPYIICMAIIIIIQIPIMVTQLTFNPAFFNISVLSFSVLSAMYAFFAIGYLYYSSRLYREASKEIKKRAKDVTYKMSAFCIGGLIFLVIYIIWNYETAGPWSQATYYFFSQGPQQWPFAIMMWSIYVKWDPQTRSLKVAKYQSKPATHSTNIESVAIDTTLSSRELDSVPTPSSGASGSVDIPSDP